MRRIFYKSIKKVLLLMLGVIAYGQNVGIGTPSPASKLSVNGNLSVGTNYIGTAAPTNGAIIEGNVGIGVTVPQSKLHVSGDIRLNGTSIIIGNGTNDVPFIQRTTNYNFGYGLFISPGAGLVVGSGESGFTFNANFPLENSETLFLTSDGGIQMFTNMQGGWGSRILTMILTNTGNVGIGVASPTQRLHVQGNMRLTGALYDSNNQPGAAGEVLVSTGTTTDWQDPNAIGLKDHDWYEVGTSNPPNSINDNIYTNGRVGIGTGTPNAKLDIRDNTAPVGITLFHNATGNSDPSQIIMDESTANSGKLWIVPGDDFDAGAISDFLVIGDYATNVERFWFRGDGTAYINNRLGIRTTNPGRALDVADRIRVRRGSSGSAGMWLANSGGTELFFVGLMDTEDRVGFWRGGVGWSLVMDSNGRVGVGTTSPTTSLDINGNLRVRSLPNGAANDQVVVADASGNIRKRPTRAPAWSTADYDSGWFTMQSQAGTNSFRELTHGFGAYPSKVLVLVRPTSGANAGFIFEGVGAAQNDDDRQSGGYGGVVYAYDQTRIRLWAPDRNNNYSDGSIIYIADGWGGEVNAQGAHTAQVRVLCWR